MADSTRQNGRPDATADTCTGFDVDLALIGLTMLVTVPRVGWWMARWEQPDLWLVGYAAAVVFDLAILRLAYVRIRATARRQRAVTMAGFLFFSVCSGLFQAFYLLEQRAALQQAVPLAAIWPVALGILALHKAGEDEHQARRHVRSGGRRSGPPAAVPSRTARLYNGRREEAVRLSAAGRTVRQIALELGVPRSTVGDWVRAERT